MMIRWQHVKLNSPDFPRTVAQAQDHIEEQVEWFTDQFYDGLTPEAAAQEALA